MSVLAYEVVAWLFLVGIYGVVTSRTSFTCPSAAPAAAQQTAGETNCRRKGGELKSRNV
jgi:hypothetical protein